MRPEIVMKITGNQNPLKINLEELKICDNEISAILEMIKKMKPGISSIDLDNNNLSDEGSIILSQYLRDFDNINEISIQYNHIGRKGAIELFSLKKKFADLDILFHGNKITNVDEMDEIERLALTEPPSIG